jgi:hypothetical protein
MVYEDEAAVIRRIVDELLEGHSANAVADRLTADGIATPRGGAWRGNTVLAMIRRPHIAGLRVHNGQVRRARWEAIITPERWETLQRVIASSTVVDTTGTVRHIGRARGDTSRKWLLTGGLARCGRCGSPLAVTKQLRGDGYLSAYGCTTKGGNPDACGGVNVAPAAVVEAVVVDELTRVLANPAIAARLHHSDDPRRADLLAEVEAADARIKRAAELFGSNEIDEETWRTMHGPAVARANAARAALAATEPPEVDLPPADVVRDRWDDLPLKARQAVLSRFLSAVWVLPQETRPADARERVARRLQLDWKD